MEKQIEKTNGVVTSVSLKDGKYGISIGPNNWFNGFGECPCKKGDQVDITYHVGTNGFKNIEEVYVSKEQKTATKEFHDDKNASQLTSYAKDLVVEWMEKANQPMDVKAVMNTAAEAILEAYKKIKTGIGE